MLGTAVFLTLLRPYSLFYAINQSHVLQHEAHERMPLDEILLFNVQHAVDLRNPLATQFFNKCVHVAIKRFAAEKVLESKSTTFFHHTQRFAHHFSLVGLGLHLVENKVAHRRIKTFVGKIEL